MTDPIKNQTEGKPESAVERRHREMMQALNGEIPNAVYALKRELVELLTAMGNCRASEIGDLYLALKDLHAQSKEQHRIHMDQIAAARSEAEAASESHMVGICSLIKINAIASITRVVINVCIFVVMVVYLMDMG